MIHTQSRHLALDINADTDMTLYQYERLPEFIIDDGFSKDKQASEAGVSVLTIGDPHFKLENSANIPTYIARVESVIKAESPTFVTIMGDLLDTHEKVHSTMMNHAYVFINTIRKLCPVYVLVGNHDYINNSQFLTTNHWMNAMKYWDNVFIVDTGFIHQSVYGKFIFCPYVYPSKFIEALEIIDKDWRSARTIFCHQEFYGCQMGAIQSTIGDRWEPEYPFVVSGHVHNKQRPQANIFYTGSSIQHAFGETDDKTITMCYFDTNITLESIDLNMPRKRIRYMSVDEAEKFKVNTTDNEILKITLTGTYDDFKRFKKTRKYKELTNANVRINFKHKKLSPTIAPNKRTSNFYEVLYSLVENDENLRQLYKNIIKDV